MPAKDTCATTLRLFAEALERLGGDMAPILAAAGIAPTVLADKEAGESRRTHYRLFWRAAARLPETVASASTSARSCIPVPSTSSATCS